MASLSPVVRRPSKRRVDSTPVLMSTQSSLDTSDFIAADGRIVLTPKHEYLDDDGVYEEVETPLNDTMRNEPIRASHHGACGVSKGFSEPLILGESSMRKLHAISSYHSSVGPPASMAAHRKGLSRRAIRVWHFIANVCMACCLLAAVLTRVTAISVVYLLVLCYGVVRSFAAAPIVVFIMAVSALACVGHIVCAVMLKDTADGVSGENVLRTIGFVRPSNATSIVTHAGVDAVVLLCSVIHFFVVLRKLRLPTEDDGFDLFDAGVQLLRQQGDDKKSWKKSARIHHMDAVCAIVLFLTAFCVPAAATGVFYVVLVVLLILWTVCAKRITVDEFVKHKIEKDFFIGSAVATLLLVWSFLSIITWYVLLFPDLSSSSLGRDLIKYAGFADFARGSVQWQYYVFASLLLLLFTCSAKLVNMHRSLKKAELLITSRQFGNSSVNDVEQTLPSFFSKLDTPPIGGHAETPPPTPTEIAKQLSALPFRTRVFLRDGGSLVASAAAIIWCVSYPSYGSAPMMGWALATLGLYGLVPSVPLVVVLICYATALSVCEYTLNLTWDFVSADYAKYGLNQFEYPFLDLGVHNICLFVIYASMRARWRYEQVIRASKEDKTKNPIDDANSREEQERNSMDAYRNIAGLRRTAQANWKALLPLWFQDAKQVILTHLGALVLLTIVAVALSTRESLFQAGYLILAMMCIVFFKHRQKLWRVLLVYALAVCLASFLRNIDCQQNDRLDLIGLVCYSETALTWRSLWPTLFTAQLVIILQLVFQLVIYVSNAEIIDQRMKTIDTSHQNPVFFISRIAVEADNCFRVLGGAVCYVAVLVVVFHFELIEARAHTTVLGGVQLVVLLIVIGGHLGKFKRTPRTSLRLKVLWSFVLVVEAGILVARYLFHFQDVSNYFEKHLFTTNFMTARDFGLEKKSSKSSLSGVFLYLAPTAVVIGLTFWQLSLLMKPVRTYEMFVAGRSRIMDQLLFWVDTLRRMLIAFSTTSLIIVTMCVALTKINAVGAAYVAVLVVGRPLSSWQKLWFPLFWVSAIAIGATYAYQLNLFGSVNSAKDGFHRVNIDDDAKWFGLDRLVVEEEKSSMWGLTSGPLLVILMCFVQRMAQYFEGALKKTAAEFVPMQQTTNELSPENGQPSGRVGSSPGSDRLGQTPPSSSSAKRKSSVKMQSFTSPLGVANETGDGDEDENDDDFFALLRDFCIEYASSASVNVVMLLLMASSFLHRDIISIAYLVVVYGMMYAAPHNVCRVWWLLVMGLSLVILVEYTLLVWLPPIAGVDKQEYPPWNALTSSQQQWFGLSNQHKWALLADFVALLASYMLPNSHRLRTDEGRPIEVRVQRPSSSSSKRSFSIFRLQAPADNDEKEETKQRSNLGDESDFMRATRTSAWHALVYFVLLGWLPVTLVVIFTCGAKHGGVASFVYIGGAVFMLYRLDDARLRSCEWIHTLRKFNWVHLFVMVIISAPYLKDSLSKCLVGENASSGDVCLSVEGLLGVQTESVPAGIIAIFVLISIQCEMLSTTTYEDICQHIQLEKRQAPGRQQEIVRHFYRNRTAQWFALKKDKSAALQRLKIIVSKLVHKVEELMDIAMGLHYNLPPMAPPQPRILEQFQNALTLEWQVPQDSLHKIRFYRITRQQYPSQTLLGDFGDVLEVKGDTTSMMVEGLRPGTSYQFKVAAVSRMGEGPFSMASDPVATYPLNLDGSCTAGWMKYRRENVAQSWLSTWLAWLQPKYLHRYVVMDTRNLVFYKNEEMALRHRSKKRRKKIKTAFAWRDVIALKLSDEKIQFDDVSPMLFCYELIVRQDGNDADLKYVFQADMTKDFDRFLSTLAFAVPRYTVDDSVLQRLREKQLPVPNEVPQGDDTGNDAVDETGSEMSSVTGGDESSFGDAEDAEFDEQPRNSWRIPLYRRLYALQDAAMQSETTEYDADDQCEPTGGEIVSVAINAIRSRTVGWCYVAMIFAFARQADVLNFAYILCTFGYLGIESPRPSSHSWLLLLKYTCVIILVRYVFQLPVFCQGLSGSGYFYPSIQPFCGAPANSVVLQEQSIQPAVVFGIYKFDGATRDGQNDIFGGLQWNFYVAIAILWHRRELIIRGLWVDSSIPDEQDGDAPYGLGSTRRQGNGSDLSSRDSIDESFNFGGGGGGGRRPITRAIPHSDPAPVANDPQLPNPLPPVEVDDNTDEEPDTGGLEAELAREILQELEAEDQQEQLQKAQQQAEDEVEDHDHAMRASGRGQTTVVDDSVNAVTEQIEMEETVDEAQVASAKKEKKKSWLETKQPQVCAFFGRVVCDPPAHWDKDIHAAIAGAKPGRDYYALSLSVMLFACIFAVIFFQQIGTPNASSKQTNGAAAPVQSSSMVSGYLVLIVFIQLCFIIWDRAAYVCGSLPSKIVLQYTYIVLLHFCLWVLMPPYIGEYFQDRVALVLFYLVHCVYLWFGALQIRYGYPVFRGSRFNEDESKKNSYRTLREKVFPLVMLAPFLFEMRALLDYVCTKTSLSWQHWVLLEDTAAHLYHVKLEMRGRVENADVLQGKQRQPVHKKLLSAGVMLLFLLLCLIGPLLLFSSANPSTTANRVTSTEIIFGIEDSRGTVNELYSGVDINSPDYEGDQIADGAAVQRITYDTFSRSVWSSSPPNVDRLVSQLESTETLSWILTMMFLRAGPTDHQNIKAVERVALTKADRAALVPMIQFTNASVISNKTSNKTATTAPVVAPTPIEVASILLPIVELTATSGAFPLSTQRRSVAVAKRSVNGSNWWTIEPVLRTTVTRTSANANDREFCDDTAPFCLIAVSDNIVQGLSSLGIGSYGITAVYIFVLVTVGSAVKGFFRGGLFQIQYTELPDPEDVLELVEGIYIARSERYVGHLKDEVRIFETLIRVLRSPETLAKVTGTNVIHIPAAKEKIE